LKVYMTPRRQHAAGFSMVELLAVIMILWLLFGMVFAAKRAVRRAARSRQAATRCQILAQAIKEYRRDYGKWPGQIQGEVDRLYGVELGSQTNVLAQLTNSPRQDVYVEFGADELSELGECLDPWGRPYLIALDENEDGRITVTNAGVEEVNVRVGVMSFGPDKDRVRIKSWSSEINSAR
jgi:type II secretory pathway pseudopilin PulG